MSSSPISTSLHEYADEHPDVSGGVEFAALAQPARLVAFVTEEVPRHAAHLRALVPDPEPALSSRP